MRALRTLVLLLPCACDPEPESEHEADLEPRKLPSGILDSKYELARWLDNSIALGRLQPEVSVVADFDCLEGLTLSTRTTMTGDYCRETASGLQSETCVHEIVRRMRCIEGELVTVVPIDVETGDPLYGGSDDLWDIESTCTPTASLPGDVCDAIRGDGVECGQPHAYCHVSGTSDDYIEECMCNGELALFGVASVPGYPGDTEGGLMLICDSTLEWLFADCPPPIKQ